MTTYTVTIRDITGWTIKVRAKGSIEAEDIAWELFQSAGDRSEHFEENGDTTVQVDEDDPQPSIQSTTHESNDQ